VTAGIASSWWDIALALVDRSSGSRRCPGIAFEPAGTKLLFHYPVHLGTAY